jgi:integron integrase
MKESIFLDQVRDVIQTRKLSYSTEKSYMDWIFRFILFFDKKSPREMGKKEISEFLTYLAIKKKVSASTRNQALNALVFLFRNVLHYQSDDFVFKHLRIEKQLPFIFSHEEAQKVLSCLQGKFNLMASLLYGSGLRLNECLKLRIKDVAFESDEIIISDDNGNIDRKTLLPHLIKPRLNKQVEKAKILFEENMQTPEFSGAYFPESLANRNPDASREIEWQFVFPSQKPSIDAHSGKLVQHHIHESLLQKEVKMAIRKAQVKGSASCHTFRHSFAIRLIENGHHIRIIQELLGHKDIRSTMIYTHVMSTIGTELKSPLDM